MTRRRTKTATAVVIVVAFRVNTLCYYKLRSLVFLREKKKKNVKKNCQKVLIGRPSSYLISSYTVAKGEGWGGVRRILVFDPVTVAGVATRDTVAGCKTFFVATVRLTRTKAKRLSRTCCYVRVT